MLLPGILLTCWIMLPACAATNTADQQAQETAAVAETVVAETKAVSTCDTLLDEAVAESRKTMKSASRACEGNTIEVTPVWSLDYKGAVHVRVFDANGAELRDEIIN